MKKMLLFLGVLLLSSCSALSTPTPIPLPTKIPPTATATLTPIPSPTPTPTLIPGYVTLGEGSQYTCPGQNVFERQPMVINHEFSFATRGFAIWFKKAGVVELTIDGNMSTISDPEFWSDITAAKDAMGGTLYNITFRVNFPFLSEGIHHVIVEYSVPQLAKTYLYKSCTTLAVLSR